MTPEITSTRRIPGALRKLWHTSGSVQDLQRLVVVGARRLHGLRPRTGGAATGLRILADVPGYPPDQLGGAESSMRATLRYFGSRGAERRVITNTTRRPADGASEIAAWGNPGIRDLLSLYRWADVIFTQLGTGRRALLLGAAVGRPVVYFVRDLEEWMSLPGRPNLLVFNAHWARNLFTYPGEQMVLHPPIEPGEVRTTAGDRVTLMNLSERKGGRLFGEAVQAMPETRFLGVTGVWANDVLPDPVPTNVELVGATADVRTIYGRTRVLLLPSRWESFGRVGVEAGLSGIPVIASPNPGSFEALGTAGEYVALDDLDGWIAAIRALDDPDHYEYAAAAALAQAETIVQADQLAELAERVVRLIQR